MRRLDIFGEHRTNKYIVNLASSVRRVLVSSREVSQEGKPNRIIHTLTQEGKIYLRAWSKKPVNQPSIKDDLMVKFYALENMDISALKEQLLIRVDKHKDLLSRYYRIKEKYYDGQNLDLTQKGKLIVLEMGIHTEVYNIERIEDSLSKIEKL